MPNYDRSNTCFGLWNEAFAMIRLMDSKIGIQRANMSQQWTHLFVTFSPHIWTNNVNNLKGLGHQKKKKKGFNTFLLICLIEFPIRKLVLMRRFEPKRRRIQWEMQKNKCQIYNKMSTMRKCGLIIMTLFGLYNLVNTICEYCLKTLYNVTWKLWLYIILLTLFWKFFI